MKAAGKDYEVTILEESSDAGGISRTVRHNGNRMDIGGHRFFSKSARVNRWWQEIMPLQGMPAMDDKILGRSMDYFNGNADPEKKDNVLLRRNRISRIYYKGKFFDYPVSLSAKTIRTLGMELPKVACSYLSSAVNPREENSLEDFYINRFGKSLYSMFFEGYTEKLWGIHPSRLSADWGAQRVKGLSLVEVLKDAFLKGKEKNKQTSLINEFLYPKFGPGQLWEKALERFCSMGGKVDFETKAVSMNVSDGGIKEVIAVRNGQEVRYDADIIISTMPLKDLAEAIGEDSMPKDAFSVATSLPYRDFVTVGVLLDRIKLRNTTRIKTIGDFPPDCWIYVQDSGVKLGRIQVFNNWSPYLVSRPQDTVWLGLEYFCSEGDKHWRMSGQEWQAFAMGELRKMGIIDEDCHCITGKCEKVKKAYPAYFGSYSSIGILRSYLSGIENLYCIGRNGQHRYNNMDHSMMTAFLAADSILAGGKGKELLWDVNSEQEYHEKAS